MKKMSIQEVIDTIPNRYPILFIDYVDEIIPGKSIVATKNVTINESFFRGHFPNNPVMPGVLIIESLAQAASILILKIPDFSSRTAYLGAIKEAKFRQKVVPGDQLKLTADITKLKHNIGIVSAKAWVDDKVVSEAQLTFIVGEELRANE